jgi:hypothetical protein
VAKVKDRSATQRLGKSTNFCVASGSLTTSSLIPSAAAASAAFCVALIDMGKGNQFACSIPDVGRQPGDRPWPLSVSTNGG